MLAIRRFSTKAPRALHVNTPLLESIPLSRHLGDGTTVWLKMDALQPSGSFKIRGIGYRCQQAIEKEGCRHLVASSGGNAGYAVAHSGRVLGIPATVVVPKSTSQFMADKIRSQGAEVIVHGEVWDEANKLATEMAKKPGHALIHPFDHPDLWEGHSTLITEIEEDLRKENVSRPDAIVTVVGGGGLLAGILQGLTKVGWDSVPVLACETKGAESFHEALKAKKLVTLPGITSVAKTLGALTVCSQVLQLSLEKNKKHPGSIQSLVVSDAEALKSCVQFVDDERLLVEPSCGAGLAALYGRKAALLDIIKRGAVGKKEAHVVVVVCGGNAVGLGDIDRWRAIEEKK